MRGYYRETIVNQDKKLQSYVIGLALGDGNLSNPNGRAQRLRITCDKKYPVLIEKISDTLAELFPQNKVSVVDRDKGYLDISVFSNHLEEILPWKSNSGSKFVQNANVPDWIKENNVYKIECLRGLIETDGSVYFDRKYKMVIFKTIILDLANDCFDMIISLGFNPHIYKVEKSENGYTNQKTAYHVRLSKNVQEFLDLVKIEKS
jgi:DNA-binding transcriptional regulator WhiA